MDSSRYEEHCPYCGAKAVAEFVDGQQADPYQCWECGAVEIGAFDDINRALTTAEIEYGWYEPLEEPPPVKAPTRPTKSMIEAGAHAIARVADVGSFHALAEAAYWAMVRRGTQDGDARKAPFDSGGRDERRD